MKDILTLGIESSCDETSVSVVKNGREVLSNVINSQIDIHTEYGGVVPEIASRCHTEVINGIMKESLKEALIKSWGNVEKVTCETLVSIKNSTIDTDEDWNFKVI